MQAAELKPGQERKEVEGVFVVRDNKAMFEMVKTGIAGEKYFEVLSGLKDGDSVVVGPFSSVRTLARRRGRQGGTGAARTATRRREMNFFLESASIALQAIWANKLRSFLTVLGNIVAVTSIIAVVSLIQGMNAYVTDTIVSGVGVDQFTIQRMPVVRTEADEERVRNNPRITLARGGGGTRSPATTSAPSPRRPSRGRASATATSRSTASRSAACRATTSISRPSTSSAAG